MKILAVIAAFAVCVGYAASNYAQGGGPVSPDERVEGRSQAEWSTAWWQWAGSFERDESPVSDKTGELCASKQSGAVWFLAGTYGTHQTMRTCTVPQAKYLFFPLINFVVMPPPPSRKISCMAVMTYAASMTDAPSILVLDIDGTRVENLLSYRQATKECFDMGAFAKPKIRVFPSAANGYYVMLRPLAPGKHVLNFGGALPDLRQAVTYTLYVK
ncbi:MAG: hypothetical protein ABI612_05655 [Betaproteobacteria bacterium]